MAEYCDGGATAGQRAPMRTGIDAQGKTADNGEPGLTDLALDENRGARAIWGRAMSRAG
ncbi:MAG: hypothetical protein ACO24A_03320 [Burkholderiaceae bacterium]